MNYYLDMDISFKDIVKLIHPDTNPNITDASGKMSLVLKYKKDTAVLWNLALKWKLVTGSFNIASPECPPIEPPTETIHTGWGYNKTNPTWEKPVRGYWTVDDIKARRTPPKPETKIRETVEIFELFDIVICHYNGKLYQGIIMNIKNLGRSIFSIDILVEGGIINKITHLKSGNEIRKAGKASKETINKMKVKYTTYKRK